MQYFILLPLWYLVIRPYCRRHGKGYTPGAYITVTAWIDWQEAGEIARERGDRFQTAACMVYLIVNLLVWVAGAAGIIVWALMAGG